MCRVTAQVQAMSEGEDWTLIAKPIGGRQDPAEFQCSELEAIELLEEGKALLKKSPIHPPRHLLAMLEERVKMIELLGPETSEAKVCAKIADKVFSSSIRQTFVDGKTLTWKRGKIGLRQLVGRILSQCSDPSCDLFFVFRKATFCGSYAIGGEYKTLSDKIYGLELDRSPTSSMDSLAVHAAAVYVPSGSLEFTYEALKLQRQLEVAIDHAISSGRIIVAQETLAGDRFVAPGAAAKLKREDLDDGYFFVPSRDLPSSVVTSNTPLHRKKANAQNWLTATCDYFEKLGKRPSQSDLAIVMRQRFDLTENAARDVVAGSTWPAAWKSGRIPEAQKVSISEIRDLN